jgi:transcriptional regulator with XRE-family HTH domain
MKRADMLARLDVGASIKKLRKEKGLSQDELAKGICDRANIAKLENGHSKTPSFNLVLLICEKFDISIEEFLNYSLKDNYSLNRDLILEYLMDNSLSKLKNYLSNIDFNSLPSKDKKYYTYLESLSLFDLNES